VLPPFVAGKRWCWSSAQRAVSENMCLLEEKIAPQKENAILLSDETVRQEAAVATRI
jgi:hypothetical protein